MTIGIGIMPNNNVNVMIEDFKVFLVLLLLSRDWSILYIIADSTNISIYAPIPKNVIRQMDLFL